MRLNRLAAFALILSSCALIFGLVNFWFFQSQMLRGGASWIIVELSFGACGVMLALVGKDGSRVAGWFSLAGACFVAFIAPLVRPPQEGMGLIEFALWWASPIAGAFLMVATIGTAIRLLGLSKTD